MKLTVFLMLISLMGVFASETYSQTTRLTVNANKMSLEDFLVNIENQSEFRFFYTGKIDVEQEVSGEFRNKKIFDILDEIKEEAGFQYEVLGRQIILSTNDAEGTIKSIQQQKSVSGTVIDKAGQPLPGVTVVVKGTTQGTVTNADGGFTITNIPENATLQFSFVGMKTQEIEVGGKTSINVVLEEETIGLEEVVAVGYGTIKRSDLTGSVSSMKSADLVQSTISSFDQGMSGRVAGVQITQQTGQPGGATSVRIRGGNSINSSNEPLFVIDGFPYYNNNNASTSGTDGGVPAINILSTINPGDIASVEILKDASATAIYGSRGANGVVMITTKRGATGKGKITFENYTGVQEVSKIIPVLNARQYAEFRNMAFVDAKGLNGNGKPTYSDEEVAAMGAGTNWQKEIFRVAPIQNYQLSISGGKDKVKYAVSGNYFDQKGVVINSGIKRYSLRANIDADVNDKLTFGNNFNLSNVTSDNIRSGGGREGTFGIQAPNAGNVIQDALFYNPVLPVYDKDGNFTWDNSTANGSGGGNQANTPNGNPVAFLKSATNVSNIIRILENVFAEYSILENLKFKVTAGIDIISTKTNRYFPSTIRIGKTAPNGNADVSQVQNITLLNENTLSYDLNLGDNHSINAVAGVTAQKFISEYIGASASDFPTDVTKAYSLQSGNIQYPASTYHAEWSLLSYLLRVNYNFKSKWYFTFSGRADGSSRFGENNKFGYFPSCAIAYRIADEPFLESLEFLHDLKLRLSAGITGNQEIPSNQTLSTLGIDRVPFSDATALVGYVPQQLGNQDIKWETTRQIDLGIDASLFEGRVTVTADAYYKKTSDLLLSVRLPYSSGFNSAYSNIGEVENKGWELALNLVNIKGEFNWSTQFNISLNRNKVLDFGPENERYIGQDYNLFKGQAVGLIRKGEPLGNFVGYINDGIIKNQAELDAAPKSGYDYIGARRFVDLNNDGVINNEDRTIIGNALPDYIGGINNSFSYKNFSLDFLFQFTVGNDIYNMTQVELEFLNGRQNNSTTVLDRFIPGVNEDTDVARAGNPTYTYERQSHSRWIEDGSFLRLKNLTLAYNIPVSKINWLSSARIYLTGQNLWLLSKYRGYDPEVNINPQSNTLIGYDYASYPSAKVYMLGVNIGL